MFNLFKNKNLSPVADNPTHKLRTDRQIVHPNFIKQNILGAISCFFAIVFSFVLKDIILAKSFTVGDQIIFIIFFCFNMSFLTLMLFQLKEKLLMY
ncbi:MAG: hypothetical protein WC483_04435 [Candidatus Paceibacterota bacterium]|nr:hypothetical protein [Candidatus Paceibacterota bacterium]